MAEINLDTSSLSILCRSDVLWSAFKERAKIVDLKIIISGHAFEELLAGSKQDKVLGRARRISELWESLGSSKFGLALDIRGILKAELDHPLAKTPLFPELACFTVRDILFVLASDSSVQDKIKDAIGQISETKEAGLRVDKGLTKHPDRRRILQDTAHRTNSMEFMKTYSGPSDGFAWFFERIFKDAEILSSRRISMADIRTSDRYLAAKLFLSLCEMQMYGALLAGYSKDLEIQAFKVGRGNRYDASIVASAAYSDQFIVDDRQAYAKAQIMCNRGIAKFQLFKIVEWLKSDGSVVNEA